MGEEKLKEELYGEFQSDILNSLTSFIIGKYSYFIPTFLHSEKIYPEGY